MRGEQPRSKRPSPPTTPRDEPGAAVTDLLPPPVPSCASQVQLADVQLRPPRSSAVLQGNGSVRSGADPILAIFEAFGDSSWRELICDTS